MHLLTKRAITTCSPDAQPGACPTTNLTEAEVNTALQAMYSLLNKPSATTSGPDSGGDDSPADVVLANSIWARGGLPIKAQYSDDMMKFFNVGGYW